MKKIVCWGGDARMQVLTRLLQEAGYEACHVAGNLVPDMDGVEDVILPVPTLDGEGRLAGSQGKMEETGLLALLPEKVRVTAYLPRHRAEAWRRARPDMNLLSLGEEEDFLEENGAISAEGAVKLTSGRGRCLRGKHCLILGYGHMGRPLCRMLVGLGARVSVAGRRGGTLETAGREGFSTWDLVHLRDILPHADWVMNTIPFRVLGKAELGLLKRNCRLVEFASAPYGIDEEAARLMGLDYSLEAAIPGRLYEESAAAALLRAWQRMAGEKEGYHGA